MILKIFKNATKSLRTDVNGKNIKYGILYILFVVLIPLISFTLVFINWNKKLFENSAIFASLLSLFIGLIFGVLMKVPDKLSDLKIKDDDNVDESNKKTQAYNFLVSFRDYLSFNIVIAILIIALIVLNNFFPGLSTIELGHYYSDKINLRTKFLIYFIFIMIYRFILICGISSFIFYLILTISNLYEFTLYEFKKNYK